MLFPHVYQKGLNGCGAACAGIIAKYYLRENVDKNLPDIFHSDSKPVNLVTLKKAFHKMGFDSWCFKLNWYQLKEEIPLPCIIHWYDSHFIVLYKIADGYVFVSDPARGLLKYAVSIFIKGWLQNRERWVVMIVKPTG